MAVPGEACLTSFFRTQHIASPSSRYQTLYSKPVDTLSSSTNALLRIERDVDFCLLFSAEALLCVPSLAALMQSTHSSRSSQGLAFSSTDQGATPRLPDITRKLVIVSSLSSVI